MLITIDADTEFLVACTPRSPSMMTEAHAGPVQPFAGRLKSHPLPSPSCPPTPFRSLSTEDEEPPVRARRAGDPFNVFIR